MNASAIFSKIVDAKHVNAEATAEIKERIKSSKTVADLVGFGSSFNEIVSAFDAVLSSRVKESSEISVYKGDFNSGIIDRDRLAHITLCVNAHDKTGSFILDVFPRLVLIFLENRGKAKFLIALNTTCLHISEHSVVKDVPVVVEEKTQNDIRYYDIYSPVPDSVLVESYWERTNRDGKRSFAGGLKPENNPLHFVMQFRTVKLSIGMLYFEATLSASAAAKDFVSLASAFLESSQHSCSEDAFRSGSKCKSDALSDLNRSTFWGWIKGNSCLSAIIIAILAMIGTLVLFEAAVYIMVMLSYI